MSKTQNIATRPSKNSKVTTKSVAKKSVAPSTGWATVSEGKITGLHMTRSQARQSGLGTTKKVKLTFI